MRSLFLLSLLTLATGAAAADKAHCDAKPFTLNKPAAPAPAEAAKPSSAATPAKVAQASPQPKTAAAPKPKPKVVIGCKQTPAK